MQSFTEDMWTVVEEVPDTTGPARSRVQPIYQFLPTGNRQRVPSKVQAKGRECKRITKQTMVPHSRG